MNLPNKITILRVLLIPVMIALFLIPAIPYHTVIAAAVFLIAAFTDFLDGYIARKRNLVTDFGKFLDPIADKVLVISALLLILEAGIVPYGSIGVAVIIAREFMVSAFRMIASSKGTVIAADKLGKIKTVCQDACIPFLMIAPAIPAGIGFEIVLYTGYTLFALAVVLTVWSGIAYLVKNKGVLVTR